MGIFRSSAEKTAKKWATPNCQNCRGTGRVQGAGNWMESCACVYENQKAAVQAPRPRPQDNRAHEAFLRQLTEVPPDELTPEEFFNPPTPDIEVRKFLILVSHKATEAMWTRVKAKQITRCCLAATCVCTLNYWDGGLLPKAPEDENAMAWLRWWTGWLDDQPEESITALPRS